MMSCPYHEMVFIHFMLSSYIEENITKLFSKIDFEKCVFKLSDIKSIGEIHT